MASKQSKSVKKLKKRLKQLSAKIKKINNKVKDLESVVDGMTPNEPAQAPGEEIVSGSKFTAAELESATELTEDAEEVADILEKKS